MGAAWSHLSVYCQPAERLHDSLTTYRRMSRALSPPPVAGAWPSSRVELAPPRAATDGLLRASGIAGLASGLAGAEPPPAWMASLPDAEQLRASGVVNLAYQSLDDASVARVFHWLLTQRSLVRTLQLQCNQIAVLPDWIGQLTELEELHLAHNQLASLPASIGRLSKLRKLTINHNQLESLPECLGLLPALESVELESNTLSCPPMDVCRDGVQSVAHWFARRLAVRQRLAFACAAHGRLGRESPAGPATLNAEALQCLGACSALIGPVLGGREVAERVEEEAGQSRAGAAEMDSSRVQLATVEACGWLNTQGKIVKNWKDRWFTLCVGELCYYEQAAKTDLLERLLTGIDGPSGNRSVRTVVPGANNPRGRIDLLKVFHIQGLTDVEGEPPTVELSTVGRAYLLRCQSVEAMAEWVKVLSEALHAVVVLGESEVLSLRQLQHQQQQQQRQQQQPRVLHHIVDVAPVTSPLGSPGEPTLANRVRQTFDFGQMSGGGGGGSGSGGNGYGKVSTSVATRSLKIPSRPAWTMSSGVAVVAPPVAAGDAAGAADGAGVTRDQRAGSVGMILPREELELASDAFADEMAAAWLNMPQKGSTPR